MRGLREPLVAAFPGLVVATAALIGLVPSSGDLPTYFMPLRQRTAEVLRGEHNAFWNAHVGCGEPFFANPQTGLLYPPGWLAAVVDARRAVGVEVGLHLAVLAAGCAVLALQLGAGRLTSVAAGWGAALAGPCISAAGVLNNLAALSWLPWLLWSVLRRQPRSTALFAALPLLAGEPQLAAVGLFVAITLVPSRRTVAALAVGAALTAAQALPFVSWVATGDRGPASPAGGAVAGFVEVARLPALAVPGIPPRPSQDVSYLEQLSLPAWVVFLAAVAIWRRRGAARRLALWGWAFVFISVLPALPGGDEVWTTLSLGLLRYPSRLLLPAVVALVAAAAVSVEPREKSLWPGLAVTGTLVVVAFLTGATGVGVVLAALGLGLVLCSPLRAVGALIGVLALVPGAVNGLRVSREPWSSTIPCLDVQRGSGRVFVLEPSREQLSWARQEPSWRPAALGWGYTALLDGRWVVRSFAPVQSRRLAEHVGHADVGPQGRWWLDTLGASRIVAHHPVDGLTPLCNRESYRVLDNPAAWPEVVLAQSRPAVGQLWEHGGEIISDEGHDARRTWRVTVEKDGGVLLWMATPDRGWRFEVDGQPVRVLLGPGIIQAVPLPGGDHAVSARYRPPGLFAGVVVSLIGVLSLGGVPWRRL